MTRKTGLTLGCIILGFCLIAFGMGAALLICANIMPSHTDTARANELTILYEQNYLSSTPEQRELAGQQIALLRTSKWRIHNIGLSFLLSSLCLLLAVWYFRLWNLQNVYAAKTPRNRLRLLGLASFAWWTMLPAVILGLEADYAQDDLTPTMDTGHGILFVDGPPFFLLVWIAIILVGRFLILRRSVLPANLWCWNASRPNRSLILTFSYALLSGGLALLMVWSVINYPWMLPSLAVGLYVVLSTRAALVNVTN
jgi:hypothetical protein